MRPAIPRVRGRADRDGEREPSEGRCAGRGDAEAEDRRHDGAVKSIFGSHGDTGLTEDEEVTHFGMWCMMSSPLLIGCDVRTLPAFTKRLVTNPYLIALNLKVHEWV